MNPMTKEQRTFAEANHDLVLKFMNQRHLPIWTSDTENGVDWYGVVCYGYCMAVIFYKPESNLQFSTLAYTCMTNAVKQEKRRIYNVRNGKGDIPLSLEDQFSATDKESDISFIETLADEFDMEKTVFETIEIAEYMKKLNTKEKLLLQMIQDGYTQIEIAEIFQTSQSNVSRYRKKIEKNLKKIQW